MTTPHSDMITHHTEPDGTLVIRVSAVEEQSRIRGAVDLARKAAEHFGIGMDELLGRSKTFPLADCRFMAIRLIRESGVKSWDLARIFGRDLSSVGYALRKASTLIQVYPDFARRYDALRAAVIEDGKEARSA